MANAIKVFGSDLKKGNGTDYATASTWTSVGAVQSITPPNPAVDDVEIPKCVNDASLAKEFIPGAYDPGESAYTLLYASGSIGTALAALGTEGCWAIKLGTLSSGQKHYAFNGYFKAVSVPQMTSDGFISVDCTIKVSGEPDEITIA